MNKIYFPFSLLLSLLLVVGCTETEYDTGSSGLEYQPLEIGKFWEYAVDSLIIDDLGATKYFTNSFIKETIVDEIIDGSGNSKYLYEKAWKKDATDEYKVLNIFSIRVNNGSIYRNENNLEMLNIQAPIDVDQCWDGILFDQSMIQTVAGNSIEFFKSWNFKVTQEFGNSTIGGVEYDRVLTVQQADDENAIERRFSQEKYQQGVGMIQRRQVIYDTQCIAECEGDPWEDKAEIGFQSVTNLIAHN